MSTLPDSMNAAAMALEKERSIWWRDLAGELERTNAKLEHALNIARTELRLNGCDEAADKVAKLHDAARKEMQP